MTYLFLYILGLAIIWAVYKYGWFESLKLFISIIVPSFLIILFNLKTAKFLFKNPIIGILSALPTAIFIFRGSQPIVSYINNWIDNKKNNFDFNQDVVDTDAKKVED